MLIWHFDTEYAPNVFRICSEYVYEKRWFDPGPNMDRYKGKRGFNAVEYFRDLIENL